MTKRSIDVDDAKLGAVRDLLGTKTLKATVDTAFDEVLALDERRRALLAERGVDLAELADPQERQAAWGWVPTTWVIPRRSRVCTSERLQFDWDRSSRVGSSPAARRLTLRRGSRPGVHRRTAPCGVFGQRGLSFRWTRRCLIELSVRRIHSQTEPSIEE
jgi:hypothetical protein